MFNEIDMEVLDTALGYLNGYIATATGYPDLRLDVETLACALDHAGVCGLVHDGSRGIRDAKSATWANAGLEHEMQIEQLGNRWIIRCLVRGGIIATYSDYADAVAALRHMRGI